MPSIKDNKLLYHLTSLKNIGSILDSGLQPRSALSGFHDVADAEILSGRGEHGLDNYVPFHWFCRNPFDGRVQKDRPEELFLLIAVRRSVAEALNWKVLPFHPLSGQGFKIFDYREGFECIDWDLMDCRDYSDPNCKKTCMAECLSPEPVYVETFQAIYVPTDEVQQTVICEAKQRALDLRINLNRLMFC